MPSGPAASHSYLSLSLFLPPSSSGPASGPAPFARSPHPVDRPIDRPPAHGDPLLSYLQRTRLPSRYHLSPPRALAPLHLFQSSHHRLASSIASPPSTLDTLSLPPSPSLARRDRAPHIPRPRPASTTPVSGTNAEQTLRARAAPSIPRPRHCPRPHRCTDLLWLTDTLFCDSALAQATLSAGRPRSLAASLHPG
jgi:hypothetical protein